jgi:hypothetical protein
VQVFDKEGRTLSFFGGPGPKRGNLVLPAKPAIDYENLKYFEKYVSPTFEPEYLVVVTSQFGPSRVNLFAFGKQKGTKYPTEEEEIQKIKERAQKFLRENPEKAGEETDQGQPKEK